jgi:hypothetical protein
MQKFILPAALAIALTAGGNAFADTASKSIDHSLYTEATQFVSHDAPAGAGIDYLSAAKRGEQRASTAPMPAQDWEAQNDSSRIALEQPE